MTTYAIEPEDVDRTHFNEWVHEMRTTLRPQAQEKLADEVCVNDTTKTGFCCLGLGCTLVPDLAHEVHVYEGQSYDDEPGDDTTTIHYFGAGSVTDLAPPEFITWLVPSFDINRGAQYDLVPDYPEGLSTQGTPVGTSEGHMRNIQSLTNISAAKMNDDGFTFRQIADVFAYFGIGAVVI